MFKTFATQSGEKLSIFNCHRQYNSSLPVYKEFFESIKEKYDGNTCRKSKDRIRNAVKDRDEKYQMLLEEYERNGHYDIMHREEITEVVGSFEDTSDCNLEKLRCLYDSISRECRRPRVSLRGSIKYDGTNGLFMMTGDFNDYSIMEDRSLKDIMDEENDEGNHVILLLS